MGNYFDQFDNLSPAPQTAQERNYFDQFDQPASYPQSYQNPRPAQKPVAQKNYFDQFDNVQPAQVQPVQQAQYAQPQPIVPAQNYPAAIQAAANAPPGFPTTPPPGFPLTPPAGFPGKGLQYRAAPVSAPVAASPKTFALGAQVQQWINEQPIVKDFQSAGRTGNWGNFAGSMFTGLPAGPLDMVDTLTSANNWVNDQFVNPAVQWGVPREIAEPMVQAINPIGRKTDFANQYKNLVKPSMPGAFGGGQFIGGALLPMGNVAKGASVGRQMLQGAGLSGGVSAFQNLGNQYRTTGQVNPIELAGATALGGLLGGAAPAVGAGIGRIFRGKEPIVQPPVAPIQQLQDNAQGALNAMDNLIRPPVQVAPPTPEAQNAAQQFFKALGMNVDELSPESVAAAQQLTGTVAPRPLGPVGTQATSPAIEALRNLGKEAQIPIDKATARRIAQNEKLRARQYQQANQAPPAQPAPTNIQAIRDQISQHVGQATDHAELDNLTEDAAQYISKNVKSDVLKQELKAHLNATREGRKKTLYKDEAGIDTVAEKLDDVANSTEPAEAEVAIKEWAKEALGADDAGEIMAGKTVGDFRRTIDNEFKGKNKAKLAVPLHKHPIFDSRKSRSIFQTFGRAKAELEHAKAIEKDFKHRFLDQFVDKNAPSYTARNGMKLNRLEDQEPTFETFLKIDKLRDEMTDGVEPARSQTLAGMITQHFGHGPELARIDRAAMPENLVDAENKLLQLHRQTMAAQAAYDKLKVTTTSKEVARLKEAVDKAEEARKKAIATYKEKAAADRVLKKTKDALADKIEAALKKVDDTKAQLAEAQKLHDAAQSAQDHLEMLEQLAIKTSGEPTAMVHIKGNVPHPIEGEPPLEFSLEFRKGAMQRTMSAENRKLFKELEKEILSEDKNRPPRYKWSVVAPRATLGAIAGALVNLPAHAANSMPMQVMNAWDYMPVPEMIGGLVALHGLAPKVAKAVLSEKNFKVGTWFKDTMDNIEYLEKSKVIPAGLVREVWNHQAQVLKSQKGVKIDDELKAKCIESLREGKDFKTGKEITAKNCLERTPDTVFEGLESEAQAHALVMHKIAQENLAKITRKADKQLGEWLDMAQSKDEKVQEQFKAWLQENKMEVAPNIAAVKSAREAMSYMLNQLSPRGEILNDVDRLVQRGKSNFMEAAFGQNLEFSGTNLTDLLISGGAYAGPINVLRATNLVNFNKEFRALLHDSHFAGGFQVDRTESAALAGGVAKKKLPWDKDFKSDLFNANRLAVASLLQHAQINKELLANSGFNGSDVDFAKAVLGGSPDLDPVIGADAYIHMAKALSRVLGMDILKVNTDIMSRSRFGNVAGVFFKQPARMARLVMQYMSNGEFSKMYTLLGFTALFGGSAAIPNDLATIGQIINPDSYFRAANAFDQIDMYQKVTGEKLTPKIQWSIFWVSMAGQNPVWQNISDAAKNFGEGYFDNKPIKFWKGALKLLPIFRPKQAGINTRNLVNAGTYAYEAVTGKDTLYGTNSFGFFDPEATKQVTLDRIKKHPLVHYLSQYVPGKSAAEYQNTMSSREHDARRAAIPKNIPGITGKRPGNAQFYEPKNIYNQPDPASWFLRGGR